MSQPISSQLVLLNQCTNKADIYRLFHKLLDICYDTTTPTAGDASSLVTKTDFPQFVSDQNLTAKFVPSIWCDEASFHEACRGFIKLFVQKFTYESEMKFPELSEHVKSIFAECFQVREKELFKSIVFKVITTQEAHLVNYDWQVSVVLASNLLAGGIKESILKLSLMIQEPFEVISKGISFEFTKDELGQFIHTLEDAKRDLIKAVNES